MRRAIIRVAVDILNGGMRFGRCVCEAYRVAAVGSAELSVPPVCHDLCHCHLGHLRDWSRCGAARHCQVPSSSDPPPPPTCLCLHLAWCTSNRRATACSTPQGDTVRISWAWPRVVIGTQHSPAQCLMGAKSSLPRITFCT